MAAWYDAPLTSLGNSFGDSTAINGAGQWFAIGSAVASVAEAYYSARVSNIQAEAQASAYRYQSEIAKINAQSAYNKSLKIRQQGEIKAGVYGLQAAQQIANTIANQGASGVKIGYGSSANVVDSMKFSAAHDIWSMSMSTLSDAQAAESQSMSYKQQASSFLMQASQAKGQTTNPWMSAGQAALSGFGSMLSAYASQIGQAQQQGKQRTNAAVKGGRS